MYMASIEKEEKREQNAVRCMKCKYFGMNACSITKSYHFETDFCILDNPHFQNRNQIESFMFEHAPLLYVAYLNKTYMDVPKAGDKVVMLTNGHCGYAGVTRIISSIEDGYYHFSGLDKHHTSICKVEEWYKNCFVIG